MRWKRMFALPCAALIMVLADHRITVADTKVQFSIIYTNDVMGEVEPCG